MENLKVREDLFSSVKYYISGNLDDKMDFPQFNSKQECDNWIVQYGISTKQSFKRARTTTITDKYKEKFPNHDLYYRQITFVCDHVNLDQWRKKKTGGIPQCPGQIYVSHTKDKTKLEVKSIIHCEHKMHQPPVETATKPKCPKRKPKKLTQQEKVKLKWPRINKSSDDFESEEQCETEIDPLTGRENDKKKMQTLLDLLAKNLQESNSDVFNKKIEYLTAILQDFDRGVIPTYCNIQNDSNSIPKSPNNSDNIENLSILSLNIKELSLETPMPILNIEELCLETPMPNSKLNPDQATATWICSIPISEAYSRECIKVTAPEIKNAASFVLTDQDPKLTNESTEHEKKNPVFIFHNQLLKTSVPNHPNEESTTPIAVKNNDIISKEYALKVEPLNEEAGEQDVLSPLVVRSKSKRNRGRPARFCKKRRFKKY